MYFDLDRALCLTTPLMDTIAYKVSITGLGWIPDRFTLQKEAYDTPTVIAIVAHRDYDNVVSQSASLWFLREIS